MNGTVAENQKTRLVAGDILRRAAERFPDRHAFTFLDATGKEEQISYRDLNEQVNRAANALSEKGIQKGDRVVAVGRNSPEFVIMAFAAMKLGAWITPLNFMLNSAELARLIEAARPAAIFAAGDSVETVRAGDWPAEEVNVLIGGRVGELPEKWTAFEDLMSGDASEPAAVIDDRDIAVMFFTSGTESMPKGVMSSHRNLYMASQTYVSEGTFLRDETFVLALPMIHVAGFVCAVTCFTTGAGLVLLELPVPGQIAAAMESYNATTTGLPPTLYLAVLNDPETSSRDLTGMKKLVTWSSTIPKSMIDGWNELAPGARFLTVQASTESTACPITAGWFKEWDEVPGQDGRYIGEITYPAVDIRIVDEYGEEVPAGIAGEQLIRGPVVTAGYFENREADLKAFRDGWFHTGDIVARDEDGHLFFVDRKKDMVKSGGENVSSQEVESILGRHPDVLQCAVIGLPDAHWGEAVAAVIVKREGSTLNEDEVKTFCREYLAGFKTPKHVYFRRSLPVTSAGKLLKRALKDEFVAEPT